MVYTDVTAAYQLALSERKAVLKRSDRLLSDQSAAAAAATATTSAPLSPSEPKVPTRPKRIRAPEDELFLSFRQEAFAIHEQMTGFAKMLQRSRKAYLADVLHVHTTGKSASADAHWRDEDRDAWDSSSKKMFRVLTARITELGSHISEKQKDKSIGRHQEAMLYYLGAQLKKMSQSQMDMQMLRIERKMLQAKSFAPSTLTAFEVTMAAEETSDKEDKAELDQYTAQQRLQLEQENDLLMEEFEGMHQQVRHAQQTMSDILQLQTQLETHLSTQYEEMEQLHHESLENSDRIHQGNVNLDRAKKNSRETTKFVIFVMIVLMIVMLFLDFYAD